MRVWYRGFISLAMVSVVAVFGYCVVTQEYLWPFSPHPMYKHVQGESYGKEVLMGVSPEGEFRLTAKHSRPVSASMLRAAGGMRGKKKKKALGTFRRIYERARAANVGHDDFPELIGLRIYKASWRIRSGAANKDKPRTQLRSYLFFPPERLLDAVSTQASTKPAVLPSPDGDLVFDLSARGDGPSPEVVADELAVGGTALAFDSEKSRRTPKHSPKTHIDYEFTAPKGKYYVWVRGRSDGGRKADSVWLQLDRQLGTPKSFAPEGMGNFRSGLPKGGYAWSGAIPGAPPVQLTFKKNGKHRLRIASREGTVYIDQLWLSRQQKELPLFVNGLQANTELSELGRPEAAVSQSPSGSEAQLPSGGESPSGAKP